MLASAAIMQFTYETFVADDKKLFDLQYLYVAGCL